MTLFFVWPGSPSLVIKISQRIKLSGSSTERIWFVASSLLHIILMRTIGLNTGVCGYQSPWKTNLQASFHWFVDGVSTSACSHQLARTCNSEETVAIVYVGALKLQMFALLERFMDRGKRFSKLFPRENILMIFLIILGFFSLRYIVHYFVFQRSQRPEIL